MYLAYEMDQWENHLQPSLKPWVQSLGLETLAREESWLLQVVLWLSHAPWMLWHCCTWQHAHTQQQHNNNNNNKFVKDYFKWIVIALFCLLGKTHLKKYNPSERNTLWVEIFSMHSPLVLLFGHLILSTSKCRTVWIPSPHWSCYRMGCSQTNASTNGLSIADQTHGSLKVSSLTHSPLPRVSLCSVRGSHNRAYRDCTYNSPWEGRGGSMIGGCFL